MDNEEKANEAYLQAIYGINVKENEKIVLETKTTWSYLFALYVPGADIKAHEQVILELKNPEFSCWFAADIPGANIEEHFKVIFNSEDEDSLNEFIKEVNYKNTKVEEWLLYI